MKKGTYTDRSWGIISQLYSKCEGTARRQSRSTLRSIRHPPQCAPQSLLYIRPIHTILLLLQQQDFIVPFLPTTPSLPRKSPKIKHPALNHPLRSVDHKHHPLDLPFADPNGDGGDGVVDPVADGGVAGLRDGEVVGAGEEEGGGGIEGAVVEEGVNCEGEESGEGVEEAGGLLRGDWDG